MRHPLRLAPLLLLTACHADPKVAAGPPPSPATAQGAPPARQAPAGEAQDAQDTQDANQEPPAADIAPAAQGGPTITGAGARACLGPQNDARAAVGVAPLQWSEKLAAQAQAWAEELARTGRFEHKANNPYGENLAGYSSSAGPAAGVELWLAEKRRYRGERMVGNNFMKFGHYTQVVWRKTRSVGCGVAQMAGGMSVLVAEYDPPGNMDGEHPYQ